METKILQEKHREFGNVAKTQEINDIAIFAAKFTIISKELKMSAKLVMPMKHLRITEIAIGRICGRTGKTQEF